MADTATPNARATPLVYFIEEKKNNTCLKQLVHYCFFLKKKPNAVILLDMRPSKNTFLKQLRCFSLENRNKYKCKMIVLSICFFLRIFFYMYIYIYAHIVAQLQVLERFCDAL